MTKADQLAADRLLRAACRTAVAVLHDAGRAAELLLGGAE